MRTKQSLITVIVISLALAMGSSIAEAKDKKKPERGMLESMQSVPCGAKRAGSQRSRQHLRIGRSGDVNSHEQLCPQYLLRTDEMDYHIRPTNLKHAEVLPIGQEAVFKIKKGELLLRVPDGDKKDKDKNKYKKEQSFQVVSMQPTKSDSGVESINYKPAEKPAESTHPVGQADRIDGNKVNTGNGNTNTSAVSGQTSNPPPSDPAPQPQNQ